MLSLAGNYTASYRDPYKALQRCKDVLQLDVLVQLKRVLNHHNPTKFVGHVVGEQHRQAHAYGNHASVAKHVPKVESTLNKEELNKYVAVFTCCIELFFLDLYLIPQGLVCREEKSERLVFNGFFL